MKKIAICLSIAASLTATSAFAEDSPWLIRARAVNIAPANESNGGGPLGLPADAITVSSKVIPEVDFSYFFTPHIAAELILTYPQKHSVYLNGADIGNFKHLPPTLTMQYHFMPDAQINPYLGAGINYTRISDVNLLNGAATLEHNSWGLALQAGMDVKINQKWSFNVDVKKVQIRSDVLSGGVAVSRVKVDPVLFGVGVGYRF
jgi:outer membrane protein